MKKTCVLALLSAFAAVASAATEYDYTLSTVSSYNGNYNQLIHGFTLKLNSTAIDHGTATLPSEVILDGFTIKDTGSKDGVGVTFGFVVLDNFGNNTVLGVSTGVGTTVQNGTTSFTFTAADGTSPLTLNPESTYRYIAVSQDVLNLIKSDTTKTYVYNGGGTDAVQHTTLGNTVTITKGLRAPGIRGHYGTDVPTDSATICAGNIASVWASGSNHLSPILSNIHLSNVPSPVVPEPATATLSLLALAGLAARRRRALQA